MAQTTPDLKHIIERFRLQLEQMGIHPLRILLFGSHASGTAREGSDIDLIVISDDWIKYNQRERLELLGVAAARILEPVQAQGFTTSEISLNQVTPFWEHVMKEEAITV
jgi:predicted nucleotidyltransferase